MPGDEHHRQQLQLQHLRLTSPPCPHDLIGVEERGDHQREDILVEDILQVGILLPVEDNPEEDILEEDTLAAEGKHQAAEGTAPVDIHDQTNDQSYRV